MLQYSTQISIRTEDKMEDALSVKVQTTLKQRAALVSASSNKLPELLKNNPPLCCTPWNMDTELPKVADFP